MDDRQVELIERVVAFNGYFKILRYRLRHSLFQGGMSKEVTREIFERGQAVAVLPYDPVMDRVVLIEQFRPGALDIESTPWLIETVAGIVETGETHEDVARRESKEEAGIELKALRPIGRYFVSPGGTTETVHIFIGHTASETASGYFGVLDEGEDIKVHVIDFEEAMKWLGCGKIKVMTTVAALQWLALNRHAVQDEWLSGQSKA